MYEIIIGKAIGSIKIGMKREEVRNLFPVFLIRHELYMDVIISLPKGVIL